MPWSPRPWSPSSTEVFLACPMAWYLKRQGVQGRPMDTTAMDQGTEFHTHMAAYWWCRGDLRKYLLVAPWHNILKTVIDQEGDALRENGFVGAEVVLGGPPEEAARHGRYPGTCDLVTENETGLTVTDYKTKAKMDPRFADRELRQTQRSWQLRQYAWFVQEKYGRPVTQIRKLLVAFTPVLKVWLATYPVTPAMLNDWAIQAHEVWNQMDRMIATEVFPWQNPDACERYGWDWRCQFYEICWDGAPMEFKETV